MKTVLAVLIIITVLATVSFAQQAAAPATTPQDSQELTLLKTQQDRDWATYQLGQRQLQDMAAAIQARAKQIQDLDTKEHPKPPAEKAK